MFGTESLITEVSSLGLILRRVYLPERWSNSGNSCPSKQLQARPNSGAAFFPFIVKKSFKSPKVLQNIFFNINISMCF